MLAKLEGFCAALLGRLERDALVTVVNDLDAVRDTILARRDLSAVLSDTSITHVARGLVLRELLTGKVSGDALRLSVYAASSVPAPEVPHAFDELAHVARALLDTGEFRHTNLGLLDSRRRVGGFADAYLDEIDAEEFPSIEDDLFRWARTVEGNVELRHLMLDRDAALAARLGITNQLLEGKVNPSALALARFTIVGGRPRDVVGTLDFLVNYVAQVRGWRVARVHTARSLEVSSQNELISALGALTGKSVELQIQEEPALLSGVLVEIGDLRLDASTKGRLSSLRDAVTSGGSSNSTRIEMTKKRKP